MEDSGSLMLEYLRIQNLALIEDVALEFSPGINVLSGETGAGKSFILKALNFLTGERLESDLVRPGKEKASAEAVFSLPDGTELMIRRELTAETGRSRLFINDALSSQESVRELKPALLLHTSQHGQQKLLQPSFQAKILDDFMNRPDLLSRRDELLKKLDILSVRRAELEDKFKSLEDKRDLLEYQRQEIEKVNPKAGEEEELEMMQQNMRQSDARNSAVEQALGALHGADSGQGMLAELAVLERAVKHMAAENDEFTVDMEFIESMHPALSDLSSRLRKSIAKHAFDFDSEKVESRLFEISQLKRKLRRSLSEILSLRDEIIENLTFLDSCVLDLKQLSREEIAICDELALVLKELNPARREAAQQLKLLLESELRELGFSELVEVEFMFSAKELFAGRSDCSDERAQIYWKPNPGQAAQALDRIASGGELSRFLLSLVSLLSRRMTEEPTLIFDEVDSGVGGITLNKVAEKLRQLGSERQMILISHWPNLAATAQRHFFVEKEVRAGETFTCCVRLEGEEVFDEIARMGGGGEQGRALARELLGGVSM